MSNHERKEGTDHGAVSLANTPSTSKGTMKTRKGQTKTSPGKDAEGNRLPAVTIAEWQYDAPETQEEYNSWSATGAPVVVTGTVTASGKAFGPESITTFERFLYGMDLKANEIGREAADIAKEVQDHKLSMGGKSTDLDMLTDPALLAKALNRFVESMADGVSFGTTNDAKIRSKVDKAIAAGMIHKGTDGALVAGPAPTAPATPEPVAVPPKANGGKVPRR